MVAVCKYHAHLKIPRIIRRAGERRDFSLRQFRSQSLQRRVGKTERENRIIQTRRTAGRDGKRRKHNCH